MGEFEKMNLVQRKVTAGMNVAKYLLMALTVLMVIGVFLMPLLFTIPAVVAGVGCYFVITMEQTEYEYTYYDGELKVARIRAKRKRKELAAVEMDEIITLAPAGDDALRNYSNQNPNAPKTKALDCTTGDKTHSYYVLVYNKEKETKKLFFEPEEDILKAMYGRDMRKIVLAK